eukprot:TRINITY_DN6021_c0_g1_i3.p1 TRINITY_DN6021_c0_g1~~TRINITY_DN6021_c0_g1_i3.p1  ORF type:complete len:593 (+),score=95.29 TRINITY_DN6021_c0_g1_i3:62-1840(+)
MGNEASRQRLTESLDLLESQDISENDTEFWSNLVRGRCSINELQEIFTHSNLRNIRTHQRGNFVRLVRKVGEIILLYADHGVITESEQSHAHTAMVMFIRSMPLIFEESDVDLERQIFWGIHIYDPSTFLQDCVGDHDLDSISTQYASQGHGDRSATSDVEEFVPETVLMDGLLYEARPLALKVIDAILSLMFSANFTICWEKSLISDKTWNKFGSKSETIIPEQSLCENRHILLECLLVCLMEPLYRPQAKTVPSRWLSYLTTAHYVNHREIFFSLFNVVVGYDLVGWGVPFVGSLMQDDHESLAWTALRILLILLDTNHHDFQTIPRSPNNPDVGNLFLSFLRNNLSQNDAEFVLQHISRMLKAQVSIQEGFIPNGYKSLAFVKELTHLLWLLLKTSPMVYQHATESEETTKLVPILVSVAYYDIQLTVENSRISYEVTEKTPKTSDILFFILLLLSGSERFCQRLSAPCTENLGIGMPVFYGNYGDFVALFFMDLISKSGLISPSLGSVLFSTITNISKHVRIQSLATCMSLRLMVAIFGSQWLKDRNNQSREVLLYIFEFVNTQLYFHQQGIVSFSPIIFELKNKQVE